MMIRSLGRTKIKVSELGFGTWPIAGLHSESMYGAFSTYGPSDDTQSRLAILKALQSGITLFDTADVFGHGHSETLLGESLESWPDRHKLTVVTKGGINFYRKGEVPEPDFSPYAIANAVQHSRARLKLEKLDVYLLMGIPAEILKEKEYVLRTLESLQNAGHIGAFGVSADSMEHALEVLRTDFPLDIIEFPLSMFDQSALVELLPLVKKRRIGAIAREPLANGFLGGKYDDSSQFHPSGMRGSLPLEYRRAMIEVSSRLSSVLESPDRTLVQAALRFVLDQTGVSSVAVGMRSVEQVEVNCKATYLPPLTDAEQEAIYAVFFPEG